ncbi:MAG: YwmB family TATA-box binding protein [Clostridia bacterium]|nr:YwmB family TATA-box binding protein [Clostridia bacterium]
MKKTFLIFVFIVLSILASSMYYIKSHSDTDSSEATLLRSFKNSGAKAVTSEIYFWARISNNHKNISDLKILLENIAYDIGVVRNDGYKTDILKNDMLEKLEIKGVLGNSEAVSINLRIDKKEGKSVEKTVSGTITQDISIDGLEETCRKIRKAFENNGISIRVNTCIIGNYQGKLDDEKLNNIAINILKEAEASKIEGIRDDRLISVSAYSPSIADSIKVNGKKVNLSLAIRYNSFEDKTYIWLATPVITKEY